jgi:hypothetical protein
MKNTLIGLAAFGYTDPNATIYNYWETNAPLKTSDPRCKWLLVKNNGQLMVLFCTWNPGEHNVQVALDTRALGVQPEKADNVETDELIDVADGRFRFHMPGHGVRMFHIQ